MTKIVKKSHHLYTEHLRQKAAKESTKEGEKVKAETQKRKFKEKKAEESSRWEASEAENGKREAHDAMGKAMSYIDEGGKKNTWWTQSIWWNLKQETNW